MAGAQRGRLRGGPLGHLLVAGLGVPFVADQAPGVAGAEQLRAREALQPDMLPGAVGDMLQGEAAALGPWCGGGVLEG